MNRTNLIKRDGLGTISVHIQHDKASIIRNFAAAKLGLKWLARHLAQREANALRKLEGIEGISRLLRLGNRSLSREFLPGEPLYLANAPDAQFFRSALALLRKIHRRGVAHNDLAKEANWICTTDNAAAIVDFQLATVSSSRGRIFRMLAREDLRHLLKHKRHYCPQLLTKRQRQILSSPSVPARIWRRIVKPPYLFVTRRLLGWPERDGPEERQTGSDGLAAKTTKTEV